MKTYTYSTLNAKAHDFIVNLAVLTPRDKVIVIAKFTGATPAETLNASRGFWHSDAGKAQITATVARVRDSEHSYIPALFDANLQIIENRFARDELPLLSRH